MSEEELEFVRFLIVIAVLALVAAAVRRWSNWRQHVSLDLPGAGENMPHHDLGPVTVFTGDYTEAVFLKSLIEAAGIEAALVTPYRHGSPYITVRHQDAEHARELVDDFLRNGKRSS